MSPKEQKLFSNGFKGFIMPAVEKVADAYKRRGGNLKQEFQAILTQAVKESFAQMKEKSELAQLICDQILHVCETSDGLEVLGALSKVLAGVVKYNRFTQKGVDLEKNLDKLESKDLSDAELECGEKIMILIKKSANPPKVAQELRSLEQALSEKFSMDNDSLLLGFILEEFKKDKFKSSEPYGSIIGLLQQLLCRGFSQKQVLSVLGASAGMVVTDFMQAEFESRNQL